MRRYFSAMTARKNLNHFDSPQKSLHYYVDSFMEQAASFVSGKPMRSTRPFSSEEFAFLAGVSVMVVIGWVSFFSAFTLSPAHPRTPTLYHLSSNFRDTISKPFSTSQDSHDATLAMRVADYGSHVLGASDSNITSLKEYSISLFFDWLNGATGGAMRQIYPALYDKDEPVPQFIQEISSFSSKITEFITHLS